MTNAHRSQDHGTGRVTPRNVAEPRFRLIAEVVAAEFGIPVRAMLERDGRKRCVVHPW
jgi:hypothetical protein